MQDLLHCINLPHQKWIHIELLISSLNGILICSKKINDFIAVNEHEFPFMLFQFRKSLLVCFEFFF